MLGAVVGMDNAWEAIFPLCLLFLVECPEHLEKYFVQALNRVRLWMVGRSSGVQNSRQLL